MNKETQKEPASKAKLFGLVVVLLVIGFVLFNLLSTETFQQSESTPPEDLLRPAPTVVMPAPAAPEVPAPELPEPAPEPPAAIQIPPLPTTSAPPPEPAVIAGSASAEAASGEDQMGNILYNTPAEMTLDETEIIEVRISNKELKKGELVGNGENIERKIEVTKEIIVTLCCGEPSEDHAFDISSTTPAKQAVGRGDYTQWVFRVIPRVTGDQTLQLTATAIYPNQNGEAEVQSTVLTDEIKVTINVVDQALKWLSKHWQWLGLLLLIPLMVFYVMRSLKGRKSIAVSGNESVFISYRRSDSSGYTLAIYQKLKETLGDDKVFMDLDDIPHGVDFSQHLEKVLGNSTTVLIMIGEAWLDASNEQGRRLDDPEDFVRIEVATALQRDVRVIPVLLKETQMPTADSLPEVLQSLSRRNAIRIHDDQFEASVQRLVESIG